MCFMCDEGGGRCEMCGALICLDAGGDDVIRHGQATLDGDVECDRCYIDDDRDDSPYIDDEDDWYDSLYEDE